MDKNLQNHLLFYTSIINKNNFTMTLSYHANLLSSSMTSESNLHMPIEELPPLKVSDLFDPSKLPSKEIGQKILDLATEITTSSSGAILNISEALEPHELKMILLSP